MRMCRLHSHVFNMGVSQVVFTLFISVGSFYSIAVLFGAHPINQFWGNLLWAVLMSFLLCGPTFVLIGSRSGQWTRVFLQCRFNQVMERGVWLSCLFTLSGAWVGAFPILLDWRRPWQVWPIPCCIGAVATWICFWLCFLTVNRFWPHLLAIKRTPL